MEKKKVEEMVLEISRNNPLYYKDLQKLDLQPDDAIYCEYDLDTMEYDIYISRIRLETDEEFELRNQRLESNKEKMRKIRYQQYLKLKEEFGNG